MSATAAAVGTHKPLTDADVALILDTLPAEFRLTVRRLIRRREETAWEDGYRAGGKDARAAAPKPPQPFPIPRPASPYVLPGTITVPAFPGQIVGTPVLTNLDACAVEPAETSAP